MAKFILAGYFGCGNQGDDAILLGLLNGLDRAGATHDYSVMSGSPEQMIRNHNLRGFDRRDMKAYGNALPECDAVIFPGGSIFQDATSVRSVAYYHNLVKQAKKAGKKVYLLGQGVGPVTTFLGKRMTVDAFNLADVVSVRDPGSLTSLKALGVKRPVSVTADSAFLLPVPPPSEEGDYQVGGRKSIGLVPRSHGKGREVIQMFADFAGMLFRAEMIPVLIEMDGKADVQIIDEIEKAYGGRISHLRKLTSPVKVQERLARMDGLVSMRLHGAILAATVGMAPLVISYDPKTSAFAKLMGLDAPNVQNLTAQRLFDLFLEHQRLRDRHQAQVARQVAEMIRLAEQNVALIQDAFGATAKI